MSTDEPQTAADGTDQVAIDLWKTTDAMEWAIAFTQMYPEPGTETMLGWFANAIEKGRSAGEAEAMPFLRAALAAARRDPEPVASVDGHEHTRGCECLPIRVVVDQHGHYWRDYGDHWSMCPVSTENVATEPVSEFYRFGEGGDMGEP